MSKPTNPNRAIVSRSVALSVSPKPKQDGSPTPLTYPAGPALVYLTSLPSASSRATMERALIKLLEIMNIEQSIYEFNWENLRYEHTQAIRTSLLEKYSPVTTNKHLSAIRGVMKECFNLGLITQEEFAKATAYKGAKTKALLAGRAVMPDELAQLFASLGNEALDVRDRAILALLFSVGLRRAEVTALDLASYERSSGALKVLGKGAKERLTYVTNEAKEAVEAWLSVRGDAVGPLFYPARKGGKFEQRRMTEQAIYKLVLTRQEAANLQRFSPHDARRTFISNAIDLSKDLVAVAALVGHSSVVTTSRYDRRNEAPKKNVANMIKLPIEKK